MKIPNPFKRLFSKKEPLRAPRGEYPILLDEHDVEYVVVEEQKGDPGHLLIRPVSMLINGTRKQLALEVSFEDDVKIDTAMKDLFFFGRRTFKPTIKSRELRGLLDGSADVYERGRKDGYAQHAKDAATMATLEPTDGFD